MPVSPALPRSGGQTYIALPLILGHTLLALGSIPGCHTGIEGIRIWATRDNDTGTRMAQENGFSVERTLGETLDGIQRLRDERAPGGIQRTARHQSGKHHDNEQGPEYVTRVYGLPTTITMLHSVPSWTHIRGILFLPPLVGRYGLFHKPDHR
jgi:hypothetical protein